jgi:2-phospho-L-lactate guanylyltransferase (CobY/MobA/RfbA family)
VADVVLVEQLAIALELLVEPAQGRALVARDHRAGVEAAGAVGAVLLEREPHEALHAREENAALGEQVLVVEGDLAAGAQGPPVPGALEAAGGSGMRAAAALGRRRHRELLPLKHW